jgi:glycosyltransferase involved in cell wall biosynthesis
VVIANTAGAQAYVAVAAATLRRHPQIIHLVHEQMTASRPSARIALRRSGAVLAIGANTAHVYRAALPGVVVGQINNFIEASAFRSAPPAPAAGLPTVGILARMIPEKGLVEAIDELAASKAAWSRARVAAPPQDTVYAAAVRRRIAQLALADRIDVLDWAEPHAFLDEVDVVLVPSTGPEGQPTVIIEALARGKPVIVRSPLWSSDFAGLSVQAYDGATHLGDALGAVCRPDERSLAETARRFGPGQAVAALVEAAQRASRR